LGGRERKGRRDLIRACCEEAGEAKNKNSIENQRDSQKVGKAKKGGIKGKEN